MGKSGPMGTRGRPNYRVESIRVNYGRSAVETPGKRMRNGKESVSRWGTFFLRP